MPPEGADVSGGKHNKPLSEGNHPLDLNTTAQHTGTKQFIDSSNAIHPTQKIPLQNEPDWNDSDYNRNFNVRGTNVCIHFGHNSDWSDLCIVVGRDGTASGTNNRAYPNAPSGSSPQTQFTSGSSQRVMIDLLKLYDCVAKKLGQKPTMALDVHRIK